MANLTHRPASPEDIDFAYRVKEAAFRVYVEAVWGWKEGEQRALHEKRFAAQDVSIIQWAGRDVGVMSLAESPDCLKLNQLFILPEYQGKGIGRECMALLIEEARRLDLPIRLRVLRVNPRALAFYERLGFGRIGETDTHVMLERSQERPSTTNSPGGAEYE